MKALTLRHPSLTREILLQKADDTPGAWIGIRIAGLLLILSGWKSTQVAELFGLTRWAVVKWVRKANSDGVETVTDRARSGRPPRLDEDVLNKLDEALSKSPKDFVIPRALADYVVTEYGVAHLKFKSRRQRAEALINIAHPDLRGELRDSLKKNFYPQK